MHAEQRQRTNDFLKARGLSRALFSHPESLTWLTGFAPFVELGYSPYTFGPPLLWVEDGHYTLVVLDSQVPYTFGVGDDDDVTVVSIQGYAVDRPIRPVETLREVLGGLLRKSGVRGGDVGIERDTLSMTELEIASDALGWPGWVPLDHALRPLRMVKTEEELVKLRQAFMLADVGYAAAQAVIRPGIREIDVWGELTSAIMRADGARVALGNDCTAGTRDFNIGGVPGVVPVPEGGSIIVDISAIHRGYSSDGCRTFYAGEPNAEMKRRHLFIETALDYAISLVRPGVVAREIDEKVRAFVRDGGYPVYPHHTGHGIGASLHEEPRIVPYNDVVLEAGMVILLEPGTYVPGHTGCRLEHGMIVTHDGVEIISHYPLRPF